MRKLFVKLIIVMVLFSVNGCMSLMSLNGQISGEKYKTFLGTREDLKLLRYLADKDDIPLLGMMGLIDLPLTFVMDTIFLPYTIIHDLSITKSSQSSEAEKNQPKQ